MKNFIKIYVAIICLVATNLFSAAQSSQMATLLHDGTITNFYSATAFIDALDAAVDGDVISLSSGTFTAKNISKNVSIRGVGYTVEGYNEREAPTVLTGSFNINNPKSESNQLTIEGILSNSVINISNTGGFTALKCQFNEIYFYKLPDPIDLKFIHCVIDEINTDGIEKSASLSFLNCVIKYLKGNRYATIQYNNCVATVQNVAENSSIVNSILTLKRTSGYMSGTSLNNSCHVTNSIIIGCDKSYATGSGNKHLSADTQVFAVGSFYELNDEYKQLKGIDGTEVGIHGGNLPFTPITNRPRITKFNVASKTSSDGKLSIDIEVKGEE